MSNNSRANTLQVSALGSAQPPNSSQLMFNKKNTSQMKASLLTQNMQQPLVTSSNTPANNVIEK
jgi:hypothetical protein